MSRIFVSHSSANNAAAQALASWLEENGWTDYFLDIDPSQGLAPGERWQEALRVAADRCEAVLFLISPAWRDSRWCLAEFILAKQLGKKVFGVLIEQVALDQLPREMTAEWQLSDLVSGEDRHVFSSTNPPDASAASISFSSLGLSRLKVGLQKAGLDPATFSWPPPHDPKRVPYRGLKPLDVDDAAIFFGRDTTITRGLDAVRGIRERGVEGLFIILGASGAGKSSYLRAGLWPRLNRNDREFLPLPIIRPQGAAITGTTGLVASLEGAYRVRKIGRTRAELRASIRSSGGFAALLEELRGLAASDDGQDRPIVVLPIDQAEELFGDGREENDELLDLLGNALATGGRDASSDHSRVLAVAAIRSDAYERLQSHPRLAGIAQVPFNLSPMFPADFKDVITGPAVRATAAGQTIRVEPALVDRLLADTNHADALPLLAFTLERLFVDYGGDGVLSVGDYDALGGIRGSIDAAVAAAFADPGMAPVVPADRREREQLLRRAFIPWLARIDPETEERRRRIAEWNEIAVDSQAVIERLIRARLLVRDRRARDDSSQAVITVEVCHEALLRQWSTLSGWLDEDAESLKAVEAVGRAAVEWVRNQRSAAWLVHTGERLQRAEALSLRPDFAEMMRGVTTEYLTACRVSVEAARVDRETQLARIAVEQKLTSHAQQRARRLLVVVALALIAFAGWTFVQNHNLARARAQALTVASKEALAGKLYDRSIRFAVLALGELSFGSLPEAEAQLARATSASPQLFRMTLGGEVKVGVSADGREIFGLSDNGAIAVADTVSGTTLSLPRAGQVADASFSRDGTLIVVASDDKSAHVYDTHSGKEVARFVHDDAVVSAEFSADGHRVVTASTDRTARVWRVHPPQEIARLVDDDAMLGAGFVTDGQRILTLSKANVVRVFDAENGREQARLVHQGPIVQAVLSDDRERLATASGTEARVFDLRRGKEVVRVKHDEDVLSAAFSPDGARIATGSNDQTARVTDLNTGRELVRVAHPSEVDFVAFSADGARLISGSEVVVVSDVSGREIARTSADYAWRVLSPDRRYLFGGSDREITVLEVDTARRVSAMSQEGIVSSAAFSHDGLRLVTGGRDGTARLWDVTAQQEIASARHSDFVVRTATSSDGVHFAAADWGGSLVVSELISGREVRRVDRFGIIEFAFSPNGHWLATGFRAGGVKVSEVVTGKEISSISLSSDPRAIAFSSDSQRLYVTTADGATLVSDTRTGNPVARMNYPCRVSKADFSADRRRVTTVCEEYSAQVLDIESRTPLGRINHGAAVRSIEFLSNGTRVLTASDDKTARISDAVTGKELCRITHDAKVPLAIPTPDDSQVVTVSEDQTIRISDALTCAERIRLATDVGQSIYATFSPDRRRLALSDGRSGVSFYDTRTWGEIGRLTQDAMVSSLAFSPDGTRLVTGSIDELSRVWDTTWLTTLTWPLLDKACKSKLLGSRTIAADDVVAVPLLDGRLGEDVCGEGSLFTRLVKRVAR